MRFERARPAREAARRVACARAPALLRRGCLAAEACDGFTVFTGPRAVLTYVDAGTAAMMFWAKAGTSG